MLSITDSVSLARVFDSQIDRRVSRLLKKRSDQLGGDIAGLARFAVLQPGDTSAALEREFSFSVFQNAVDGSWFGEPEFSPSWEWIEDHGFAYELVFIFDDSGFAYVAIVPKSSGIDCELRALCEAYA